MIADKKFIYRFSVHKRWNTPATDIDNYSNFGKRCSRHIRTDINKPLIAIAYILSVMTLILIYKIKENDNYLGMLITNMNLGVYMLYKYSCILPINDLINIGYKILDLLRVVCI